jgi:hypothetical protein
MRPSAWLEQLAGRMLTPAILSDAEYSEPRALQVRRANAAAFRNAPPGYGRNVGPACGAFGAGATGTQEQETGPP